MRDVLIFKLPCLRERGLSVSLFSFTSSSKQASRRCRSYKSRGERLKLQRRQNSLSM